MGQKVKKTLNILKHGVKYGVSFTIVTGIVKGIETAFGTDSGLDEKVIEGVTTGVETAVKHLPFFLAVNFTYSPVIKLSTYIGNLISESKGARVAANAVCLGVNAGFYYYAQLTGDSDPLYQTLAITGAGLYLTNKHVSDIEKENLVN
ncbi:MAG: hypothetical protein ABH828_04010 [archaeon]